MTSDPKTPTNDTSDLIERLSTLLERSMTAWGLLARVKRDDAGGIAILAPGHDVRIARAAPGAPFRWMVTVNERKRPAVSILAVLRQVRQALDPGYATSRVRIAPMAVSVPRDETTDAR